MKLSSFLLYLSLIIIGSIIGVFLSNYSYFVFEKEISFFDLFSLVVTTSIGIYLAVRLGRVLSKENTEKQLLVDEIKKSIESLDEINSKIETRNYDIRVVAALFKTLNENLHLLTNLINSSHCKKCSVLLVRKELQKFRRILTGQTSITNNVITLDSTSLNTAKQKLKDIKLKYFELIFSINKA